eukprot:1533793-Ditylum_brightwellii.AAC.2
MPSGDPVPFPTPVLSLAGLCQPVVLPCAQPWLRSWSVRAKLWSHPLSGPGPTPMGWEPTSFPILCLTPTWSLLDIGPTSDPALYPPFSLQLGPTWGKLSLRSTGSALGIPLCLLFCPA